MDTLYPKLLLFSLILVSQTSIAQNKPPASEPVVITSTNPESWKSAQLSIKATGTGNTTGHIANLTVANRSDVPILLDWASFFIPSEGKHQSYLVPEGVNREIPPQSTQTVPVNGYCVDPTVPPVGAGSDFPPFENWIHPIPALPQDWTPKPSNGWTPSAPPDKRPNLTGEPTSTYTPPATIPGTETPLNHTIDQVRHPVEYGTLIGDVYNRITAAKDKLRQQDLIQTPYSANPQKEDTIIIQQTLWIYTYSVLGGQYEKQDFGQKVYDQFEKVTNIPVSSLPEDKKTTLDQDISSLWYAFQLTGAEAKVLRPLPSGADVNPELLNQNNTGTTPNVNPTMANQDTPACGCDTIAFTVKIIIQGVGEEKIQFTNIPTLDHRNNTPILHTNKKSNSKVTDGDDILINIENKRLACQRCVKAKCTPRNEKITVSYGDLIDNNRIQNIKKVDLGGTIKVAQGKHPLAFLIDVEHTCEAEKCRTADCKQFFMLSIGRTDKACDCPSQKLRITMEKNKEMDMFELDPGGVFEATNVQDNDVFSFTIPQADFKPVCSKCGDRECEPKNVQYRIYGKGIPGLASEDKAKKENVTKNTKNIKILDKKKVKIDKEPEVNFEVSYECTLANCRPKKCLHKYTIRFKGN